MEESLGPWRVKDVLEYYREELDNEEGAEAMMRMVHGRIGNGTFFQHMNEVRNILLKEGFDVPFRARYWRAK